jgi:transcriptional regulator with XRE-family HTH domain
MIQQNPFGKNLYLDRYSLGLAQADISRAINVSQQAVARWESGRSIPRYAVLDKLKDFLEKEFKKINNKSMVCSMTDDFIPKPKEQKLKIELRDYFAAKAMQLMYANGSFPTGIMLDTAKEAYEMADAMLKAREA